jgi:RNA polymerase sigma factor (sigma-70 family)
MMTAEAMQRADINDAELVAESLDGNRDVFRLIVERYQTLISSLAYCATGNVSRSEDLAQETFVSAWKQLAELREPAKLRPWLCSIARFLISKEFRRQGREPNHAAESLEAVEEWVSPEPPPPDQVISEEEKAILWRSLERIPEIYREPLVLFYREHQSVEAVARDLGLSEDAVKQRLSRGRKLLQEQFLAFVAGALKQTSPGKAFTLGVIAALPLLATTAKAATVGTALAKHGSVAAKTTSSVAFLQAIANFVMGMISWLAAALPLGGYIGYKMAGDRQHSERARRSVATFWRIMGISMLLFFCLPPLLALLFKTVTGLFGAKVYYAMAGLLLNVCLPLFIFGVVPLALVLWIWRRRQRTVAERAFGGPISRQSPKSVTIWAALAMIVALAYLALFCWASSLMSARHFPKPRYVSTSEVQSFIANSQVRKFRFELFQSASGARRLSGDLLENGKMTPFVAPAENSTMALLAEKGISYETKIENREPPHFSMTRTGRWSNRLLTPFCCFILVAGAVTLLRGSHNRQSGPHSITDLGNERRVDKSFAALAACGMVALAVFRGVTTDWKVRTISAYQVPAVVAQHKNARFEVFEYLDGSRKLWISDLHTPDSIAPANESTLEELTRQDITYQTYAAGMVGLPGPSQSISVLWILALTAGAGSLFWWAVKSRPVSPSRIQGAGAI